MLYRSVRVASFEELCREEDSEKATQVVIPRHELKLYLQL